MSQPDGAPAELEPARLRWRCDPDALGLETTADVKPLDQLVGQNRAVDAITLALEIADSRYNLFVAGPVGTGRMTTIRRLIERVASRRPPASDWCYLHNFADPYRPIAAELPPAKGPELSRDVTDLVSRCRKAIPEAFEGADYEKRRTTAIREITERRNAILAQLVATAAELSFGIEITPTGIVSGPIAGGKAMSRESFASLSDEQRAELARKGALVQQAIDEALPELRRVDREGHEQMDALQREIALFAVGHLFDALRGKYAARPVVVAYLDAIRDDLVEHLDEFRTTDMPLGMPSVLAGPRPWERYVVNVLVTSDGTDGAPIVFEPNPTFANLVGHADYRMAAGVMQTDLRLIKAGALHRANGGYLVVEARDLLSSPYSYDALKRSLRDREVRVENPTDSLFGLPAATLKAEAIPLRVRVVLVGDVVTHTLLLRLDPEFGQLFAVKAEFTPVVDRTPDSTQEYAAFVSARVAEHGLLHFGKDAVARIVEEGARLVAHQDRLSARFDAIERLVIDADRWARRSGARVVRAEDVAQSIRERDRRASLPEEEFQRLITDGTLVIDTAAAVVGQVNGIAVMDYGDRAFARPSRITARTGVGGEGIVDVERETALSGPTHSKGVLILTGYLLGTYGQHRPLALSARLTFEQLYGGVEGDSASAAELFAILSSLANLPIEQGIAVTGSVDQHGAVQAIGAVNEKIEGHFALCKAQGLTGRQGVIIPGANVRHLMLDPEVVEAVAGRKFHVWAIRSVDEGIALLTGVVAGVRGADGAYPPDTVHGRVDARLEHYAKQRDVHAASRERKPD